MGAGEVTYDSVVSEIRKDKKDPPVGAGQPIVSQFIYPSYFAYNVSSVSFTLIYAGVL